MDISEEQMIELREAFDKFKINGGEVKNAVRNPDLPDLLEALGIKSASDKDYDTWIARMDPKGLGHVTFDHFVAFVSAMLKPSVELSSVLAAFKALEKGKKGLVSAGELRSLLPIFCPELSKADVDELLTACAANAAGDIDYTKFVKTMSAV